MAAIDKLLKFLNSTNVAEFLDDDEKRQIVQDVILGCQVDEDSRLDWLETNLEAMKVIKHCEEAFNDPNKDFPFPKSAKVVYPLLAPAVIQLASRMCQSIVRNDKVVEIAVVGENEPIEVAPGMMIHPKEKKAQRVEKFLNYEFLLESDEWLKDTHKLFHIVASWGTAFRQVYYDPVRKKNCSEVLPPEDVIINHNLTSLHKARRITVIHRMTKNQIIEQTRAGYFSDDLDLSLLDRQVEDEAPQELNPVFEVKCQFTYLDLDDDGYAEPYKVYILESQNWLLGIYPAFDFSDINLSDEGKLISIKPRIDLVDYHCIDSPDGKFYSIGLNYLLLHQNKSITSVLRQLIDAGTLSNTQGGFLTSAFKTKEHDMKFKMGKFVKLECDPTINPQQHIVPLPFKEPSNVLLGLLQTMIQAGEKTGFITDVLTGDMAGQNVPATTMLAMVEQATRAFRPLVQKVYISLKKEFKIWCELHGKYMDAPKYASFVGGSVKVAAADFDMSEIDICPVADPTLGTDSQKYAKVQFLFQMLSSQIVSATNVPELLYRIFRDLDYAEPEKMIAPPPDPSQNPDMIKLQLEKEKLDNKAMVDQAKVQLQAGKLQLQQVQTQIKATDSQVRVEDSIQDNKLEQQKMLLEETQLIIQQQLAKIAAYEAETERLKVHKMSTKSNDN
jgi:hypothetical protein